jgi:3-deoxy-D-manno-octulosonic acid (KDO) 8-phosphate synthase
MIAHFPYTRPIQIGSATLGGGLPFVCAAGPGPACSKNRESVQRLARSLAQQTRERDVPFIFRVTGPSFDDALSLLEEIRGTVGVSVAIQVSEARHVAAAARVVDLLQIPSALCRDDELVAEAAHTGRPVSIEMDSALPLADAVDRLDAVAGMGNWNVTLTDCRSRDAGHTVDPGDFTTIRDSGFPLIVDAGTRRDVAALALSGGADGICLQVEEHESLAALLDRLKEIDRGVRRS